MENKKIIYIIGGIVAVLIVLGVFYATGIISPSVLQKVGLVKGPRVIEENLVIPETQKITGGEGKTINGGAVEVALVPKNDAEKVVVTKAVLTVKGSYNLVVPEAQKWASDAKLVFVKSLGAINLEGKSSQWQIVFVSKTKIGKGYEIIIQTDQIVSKKEIPSKATGADLPKSWYDSDGAIKSLQTLPQFSDATVSSITFSFDLDSKKWIYALSTSKGATAMTVE